MKSFWIPCLVLLSLFLLLSTNTIYLGSFIAPLQEQLEEAGDLVKNGNWEKALALTRDIHERWHNHSTYLHITLRHADLDSIYVLLEEVLAYLENQKIGEYSAVNATLISQLGLLYGMEELTLQNVL